MKRIVITGATGLIGSHLIAELLKKEPDHTEIAAVAHSDRSFSKLDYLLRYYGLPEGGYRRVTGSLEYFDDCRRVVTADGAWPGGPDIVFHCAARVAVGSPREGEKLVADNVEMTHNILAATQECRTEDTKTPPLFVYTSSVAALGGALNEKGLIDESAVMENLEEASPYARSKFLSENEIWRAAAYGLPVVIVNPSVVVGVTAPEAGFWLRGLISGIRRGLPLWIEGGSAFVAADDVARAMILLSETPQSRGKRYILSARNTSYRELLCMLAAATGKRKPWLKIPSGILHLCKPFVPPVSALLDTRRPRQYDASAITRAVPFGYTPLEETLAQIARECEKI